MKNISCVIPTIRPESYKKFLNAWTPLFEKHKVNLITVWDGENPLVEFTDDRGKKTKTEAFSDKILFDNRHLFCRFTDSCRNIGFVYAAQTKSDFILTLDDDVIPNDNDPIQEHLDVLSKRVDINWLNTAHQNAEYLRGFPYTNRTRYPVKLSHGVWVGIPDFDGITQKKYEEAGKIPTTLPYYVGPIPKGVNYCCCGMNVMVHRDALPYFYFSPMGIDSGYPTLHRFADIWMGIFLKKHFDSLGWACYTGGSTILHTRASNSDKNMEQEKLAIKWNEWMYSDDWDWIRDDDFRAYYRSYAQKRHEYYDLITSLMK